MWTHLFAGVVGKTVGKYDEDTGLLLYSNGNRRIAYRNNFQERWLCSFKDFAAYHKAKYEDPDIIVARGGFKEYVPLLKKFPRAKKIYYGANHGCVPKDGIKYNLILCDSEEQVKKCRKHGLNGQLFFKPAAPQFFPRTVEKKYDVGFSAIWPKDRRKRVNWVHKTAPKDLNILQMGHGCRAPSNFSVKHIQHDRMPRAISKCKVIIAPYTKEDSCPRIIPEAIACGVPVIALESCQFWKKKYPVRTVDSKSFWHTVAVGVKKSGLAYKRLKLRETYENELSVSEAAKHLRELIIYG
jgi:hypothetical protein